jgi:hypothetical protein
VEAVGVSLERFLKNEPLSERIALIREGLDDDPQLDLPEVEEPPIVREPAGNYQITDDDREYIRRLLTEPGWRVLMQLLDNDIRRSEDAAKRISLSTPLEPALQQIWADAAYQKKAKDRILWLAENEVNKLAARKKAAAKAESENWNGAVLE